MTFFGSFHSGQGPASPKPSSFPSLPDMSPKKVSAVHNVYVSPLRSSKVVILFSTFSQCDLKFCIVFPACQNSDADLCLTILLLGFFISENIFIDHRNYLACFN